jgi:hypothetical protein
MTERAKNGIAIVVSIICSLIVSELAFRFVSEVPVFQLTNYRVAQVVQNNLSGLSEYDSLLGWRLKANVHFPEFNTIEYGVRRNHQADDHVRTGGILVVGASFTAGSEVRDEDAWPAQLETLIHQPVVNGAIGGFGLDQIVLRAEELLPITKPSALVVDLVTDNIMTAGYSYSGYPKPYFTAESGALALRNYPVPKYQAIDESFDLFKDVFSYLLVFDRIMATYLSDYWYSSSGVKFLRANNDEVSVSCLLLQRLKELADKMHVRTIVTMQYGAGSVMAITAPPGNVQMVENCARATGTLVLDEFDAVKAASKRDTAEFRSYYVLNPGDVLGHKSKYGNFMVAKMVSDALTQAIEPPAPQAASSIAAASVVEGDGQNLIKGSEALESQIPGSTIAGIAAKKEFLSETKTYRVQAIGKNGEHYIAMPVDAASGALTFSLEASAESTSHLRLQLVSGGAEGVYGDFDLDRKTASIWRIGQAINIGGGISAPRWGWRKLWITATLPEQLSTSILIQLADKRGNYSFEPNGESITIRAVQVERGNSASTYQATR